MRNRNTVRATAERPPFRVELGTVAVLRLSASHNCSTTINTDTDSTRRKHELLTTVRCVILTQQQQSGNAQAPSV